MSSNLDKLNKLYTELLGFAGLYPDSNGIIYQELGEVKKNIAIDSKPLLLPTRDNLNKGGRNEHIIFHPLHENISRGESEVVTEYRKCLCWRLNYTMGALMAQLITLASIPQLQENLSPEHLDAMISLKEADKKLLESFGQIMVEMAKTKPTSFVSIYLRRGEKIGGKSYRRVGLVSFPFYLDLKKQLKENRKDLKFFGVKLRIKDVEGLIALHEYIFKEIENKEAYNYGSNSDIAPFLHALMFTGLNISSCLNEVINLYRDYLDEYQKLLFPEDWSDHFEDPTQWRAAIHSVPVQFGNEGSLKLDEEVPFSVYTEPKKIKGPIGSAVGVQAPQESLRTPEGKLNFRKAMGEAFPNQSQQPYYGMRQPFQEIRGSVLQQPIQPRSQITRPMLGGRGRL